MIGALKMDDIFFITGYPGFLAAELIKQLYKDHYPYVNKMYVLVHPQMLEKATRDLAKFCQAQQVEAQMFTIIPGDITKPNLDMETESNRVIQKEITHVFHLAAIYDLAVPESLAYYVNVNGTHQVNEWVKGLPQLKRYIYFSTAYVSGKREGRIYERELIEGQFFKNHYEQTKYEAEILVQQLKQDYPITIIRPGIVIGHSKTGKTVKFDGLYFLLNFLDHLRFLPFTPYFGDGLPEGNFVPFDYVLEATSYLSLHQRGIGKVYHLTDTNPYSMHDIQTMLTMQYTGSMPKGKIPISLAKAPLKLAPIRKWLHLEFQAMDYFSISSVYDCTEAITDLQETNISCPDLKETIGPMVAFYRKYKHDNNLQVPIL